MKLSTTTLLANLGVVVALTTPPLSYSSSSSSNLFSNPPASSSSSGRRIPTAYESAVLGRRILALTPLATLSTVFPSDPSDSSDSPTTLENRPPHLGGMPIGMMDYIADCESSGNPTILAINIATSFKNVAAGSNISASISWTPPYPPAKRIQAAEAEAYDPLPYSAANLPRFSLLGYLEPIEVDEDDEDAVKECFVNAHPDAKYWLPGNRIHQSSWVRLVVTQVYWVGGFGDRAYIGWIDVEDWQRVTREEWEGVRLPGEKKGWSEWSYGVYGETEL